VGATIGLVFGQATARVTAEQAVSHVAGLLLVADLSLPHDSYYRPAIREKCFDGACPVGTQVVPLSQVGAVSSLVLSTEIDGEVVDRRSLSDLVRGVPQLIADVSEFMTLSAGDVLLVGVSWQAPQARVGQRVQVQAEGLGAVAFTLAAATEAVQ